MSNAPSKSFHSYFDAQHVPVTNVGLAHGSQTIHKHFVVEERVLSYRFYTHFHPYVAELISRLLTQLVPGLQAADTDYQRDATGATLKLPDGSDKPVLYADLFTSTSYDPSPRVATPYPVKDLDFTSSGAYSGYNWELFFHVPMLIAVSLSRSGQYEDAQTWFHYIFDPTDDSNGPTPERFWRVRPFQSTDVKKIEDILVNLATGNDAQLRQDTINSIDAWKDEPFRPHVIARYRQSAYMWKTVMAYLDNLIAWGDSLFRQDSREAINEAAQLYVLAANILGTRPQAVPKKGSIQPRTYQNLRADLDAFGNALQDLETEIPFDLAPHPDDAQGGEQLATLRSLGRALYFCIPRNDRLLGYWDTVADRLFKIRNSLNLQGVFRQLALFDPPIDPALLARATAAGLDIAGVVNGINQPLPLVRYLLLSQRVTEICQEVKSLGGALLSAMEKKDGESMAILRAKHERIVLAIGETVRFHAYQEAVKNREALEVSRDNAFSRLVYYERLLGVDATTLKLPAMDALDVAALERMRSSSTEPAITARDVPIDIDPAAPAGAKLSRHETEELALLGDAQIAQDIAAGLDTIGAMMNIIPSFSVNLEPFGCGASISFGGNNIAAIFNSLGAVAKGIGGRLAYEANKTAKMGSYARREQEWAQQSGAASGELNQIFKQLRAAQIRESMAQKEWKNHQTQIAHAEEIEEFLTDDRTGKKTNQGFYDWMNREVKGLYGQAFQFAFDVAKKAERALQQELGDPALTFVQYDYFSGRDGLLAGEKLLFDLKRMEMAYHDLNQREYELTKHVSLLQLDPKALLLLRTTGRCSVTLPEEVFDLDGPGHYFRRIRSVALSIPCVTGPYTSVSCTLTQRKSTIRKSPLLADGDYARAGAEDDRFSDHFGSLPAVVTSTGQNDSGTFDASGRDDRLLPFEGTGAISEWQLDLPASLRQFDYQTIADVIFHVRYTAREGGELLRDGAVDHLTALIDAAQTIGSTRLLSIRQEFPTAWARFRNTVLGGATTLAPLAIELRAEHYPFWSGGHLDTVHRVDFFGQNGANGVNLTNRADGTGPIDALAKNPAFGGLRTGQLDHIPLPAPVGTLALFLDDNSMDDLFIAITWGKA